MGDRLRGIPHPRIGIPPSYSDIIHTHSGIPPQSGIPPHNNGIPPPYSSIPPTYRGIPHHSGISPLNNGLHLLIAVYLTLMNVLGDGGVTDDGRVGGNICGIPPPHLHIHRSKQGYTDNNLD